MKVTLITALCAPLLAQALSLPSWRDVQTVLRGDGGERYLLEFSEGVTAWHTENEKWELRRVRLEVNIMQARD